MSLTCECGDDFEWYYEGYVIGSLATKRSRKCKSCGEKIAVGDECMSFRRYRIVSDYMDPEVVVRIYGDGGEQPLPTWHLCDRCGGLYESLDSLGFCGLLGQNLIALCREYAQMQRDGCVFKGEMVVERRAA